MCALVAAAEGEPPRVAEGAWGGTGIALTVDAGGGRFELDCAHGTIDAALSLDGDGSFDVPGTFVQERPGPVRRERPIRAKPSVASDASTASP